MCNGEMVPEGPNQAFRSGSSSCGMGIGWELLMLFCFLLLGAWDGERGDVWCGGGGLV